MKIGNKVWESGWGAVFLFLYVAGIIHLEAPTQHTLKAGALLPTVAIMFAADRFSNQMIYFFAGGELQRSTKEIKQITGDKDFYESASEELQTRIDDLDQRAYENNISILAGFLIAITAPLTGYYFLNNLGALGGLLLAIAAIQLLSRQSIRQLNTMAQNISEPYKSKYEN